MISEGFVRNGAKVYVSSRDAKACAQACDELNALGKGKADYITADLYKEEDIANIAAELKKRAGSTPPHPTPLQRGKTNSAVRARRPNQQQRQQLGRVLRHIPLGRMGPRPNPQPQARLPAHPSRDAAPRSRLLARLARPRHKHRQHRRAARPLARNLRLLRQQSRPAPHEPRARQPPRQARHHEQYRCVRPVPEQDDEGDAGEVQGCD